MVPVRGLKRRYGYPPGVKTVKNPMPKYRRHPIDDQPIMRLVLSRGRRSLLFWLPATTLAEKIASGGIPAPISLSDTGRAKGWFGRVIIAWQAERERRPARRQTRYGPRPGNPVVP